jgi:hypothetical protein
VRDLLNRLTFATSVLSVASMGACGSYRVMQIWELPKEYRGWVLVERANPKCRPAKLTFFTVVFEVDSSGHGCTSTPLPKGPEYLMFRQIDSKGGRLRMGHPGKGGEIWAFSDAQASNEFMSIREATQFFVGSEEEFQIGAKTRPKWWLERN